jgi:hypothetical protein
LPYIGNTPAEKYAAFNVQHFTTSATTSYTLTHAVANELDIRLVLNNVVQQPGASYAYTASATTLTLSVATTGTDTMYAVYIGKAVQTVTPGANSVGPTALQDNSVTNAKLADATQGDIIYYGAAGAPAQLAAGTSGYVLQTQGAGANPVWAVDAAGTITAFTNGVDNRVVTATSATALNGEANLNYNGTRLGVGASGSGADLGVGIHVRSADSGGTVSTDADELVLENSGNAGITFLSGASDSARIFFGDSGSPAIGWIRYFHNTNTMDFGTNEANALVIDSTGRVTKPLQPAFMSLNGGGTTLANATDVTITLDTEVFDIGSNISGNTFTAPVTGKYYFSGSVVADAGAGNNTRFEESHIYINCSNRKLKFGEEQHYTNVNDWWAMSVNGLIDMDANDTCTLTYFGRRQSGSGTCVTVGSSTDFRTGLSGYLVA